VQKGVCSLRDPGYSYSARSRFPVGRRGDDTFLSSRGTYHENRILGHEQSVSRTLIASQHSWVRISFMMRSVRCYFPGSPSRFGIYEVLMSKRISFLSIFSVRSFHSVSYVIFDPVTISTKALSSKSIVCEMEYKGVQRIYILW